MSLIAAEFFLWTLIAYVAIGLALAAIMLLVGLRRFDSAAATAPLHVKLMWVPGMVALWPVMLARALGWQPREDQP